MKKQDILIWLVIAVGCCMSSCADKQQAIKDSDIEERIDLLLEKMTLKEKIGQMNQIDTGGKFETLAEQVRNGEVGSFLNVPHNVEEIQRIALEESRLGIPVVIGRDVIHGYRTIFPIPLGQAATFNPQLVEEGARIAALEASADGIHWSFAPMLDISRDARWGRMAESSGGEDPYLASVMGCAVVKGFQGESLNEPSSIAACAKHFVGYGAAESGKDYASTFIPERTLRNVYLQPFEAVVKAGCATLMTSFNDNDGVPSTANDFILRKVLRNEWGFDGMVVSDWSSVSEMIAHGFCTDRKDAAEKAANAGLDMDMVSKCFLQNLESLVKEGKVAETTIDDAVRNILRLKFRLGLFDGRKAVGDKSVHYAAEHLEKAKEAAVQSVVLLKNNGVLPLKSGVRTIAVIGPMADAPHDQLGTWAFDGEKSRTVTPLDALTEEYADKLQVLYASGVAYSRDRSTDGIDKAVSLARKADVVLLFVGEEAILSGEAHSLADISLKGAQKELVKALAKVGKPMVTTVIAGRPLTINEELEATDAMLYSFHPGTMGGPAIMDIIFGKSVPSGKLPVTIPRMTGQSPIYYAHNNTGRAPSGRETLIDDIPLEAGQTSLGCTSYFLDAGFGPLFPFGYGLSYTTFEYSDLTIKGGENAVSPDGKKVFTTFSETGTVNASVTLANSGEYEATEVVQLYVRDMVGSVTRPVKELKSFQRVTLKPGESKVVEFALPVSELAYWNREMQKVVEPGEFTIWIGGNSQEGLSARFVVEE